MIHTVDRKGETMANKRLHTDLVGARVRFNESVRNVVTAKQASEDERELRPGDDGTIRNVYLVGDCVEYTVDVDRSRRLEKTYANFFRVLQDEIDRREVTYAKPGGEELTVKIGGKVYVRNLQDLNTQYGDIIHDKHGEFPEGEVIDILDSLDDSAIRIIVLVRGFCFRLHYTDVFNDRPKTNS